MGFLTLSAGWGPREAQAASINYRYDTLGRLSQVTYDNGNTIAYSYDASGNRTQVQTSSSIVIVGGNGVNSTTLRGQRSDYTISAISGGVVVTDSVAGRDGVRTLLNIAGLQFSDQIIYAVDDMGATIARIYQTTLGRRPDVSGEVAYTNVYKSGMSALDIVNAMLGGAEFQQKYGTLSNADFLTLMYRNAFGRAPDPGGYNGYLGVLNSGGVTRGQVAQAFAASAECIAYTAPWIISVSGVSI